MLGPDRPQSQILFRDSFREGGSASLDLPANSTLCQYSTIGGAIFLRECNFRGNGADLYSPIGDLPRAPEADLASKPPELCTQRFITEGASRVSHWRGEKSGIFKMDVSPWCCSEDWMN